MQDISKRIVEKWDEQGFSMAEMIAKTSLSESTLRRFRAGDKGVTLDTVVTVAKAVGVTIDALADVLPAPAAVAVKMLEEEYRPGGPHCATACPARKGFNDTIALIREMYESSAAREKELYERAIVEKNRRLDRFRFTSYVLLGLFAVAVFFIFYLIFIDFPRASWGLLQYQSLFPDLFGKTGAVLASLGVA